ncbi:hypothetical protein IZ6_07460 [Terrihabitans soli]|uniref:Helix-turn-helix domain-containing protein n=1 Tax=Terrihabitans soli TaxID=708113 RepID=A0A6S6QSH7_9HYPH|nr:hypothetical protein [Terrihabitans soli]BCJ90011.1 hypothetical protein IZ6_07460 [Terrihabitans soli]
MSLILRARKAGLSEVENRVFLAIVARTDTNGEAIIFPSAVAIGARASKEATEAAIEKLRLAKLISIDPRTRLTDGRKPAPRISLNFGDAP